MIYLDNAATSYPKPEAVYDRLGSFLKEHGANAGRSGYRLAIETEIKQLPEPAEPWQLKIQIQELAAGAIMIELSGHPADRPDESRIWTLNFPELETCIAGLPAVGKQVAGEL